MEEIDRIKKAYEDRKDVRMEFLYTMSNPWYVYFLQRREKDLIELLNKIFPRGLDNIKILDVGCGNGGVLRDFVKYGADPRKLYGIDVLKDRIDVAREINPNIQFSFGDASTFDGFKDDMFDVVMQFTVFTSILDGGMKKKLADNMLRVLKPGGYVLWYDYFVDNPKNPDVRGVKSEEIKKLFYGKKMWLKKITLAPPLARFLVRRFCWACYFLESLRFLNTHYLGIIKK